jgi:cysteine desulfuration protein SufE
LKSIEEIQSEIVDEFGELSDWQERYQYLIEMGDELPPFPEEHRLKENLIPGCQSRVWLHSKQKIDQLDFEADSDSSITKGMIALLVRVFSGQKKESIQLANLDFLKTIGLDKHLSISRRNGLYSMVEKIKSSSI